MLMGRAQWRGRAETVTRDLEGTVRTSSGAPIPAGELNLLAPSLPTKIVCVGRNYIEHAKELGNTVPERPLIFLKPPSSVLDPGGAIVLPPDSHQVEYEGEIAVVMGRACKGLNAKDDPMPFVAGVTPLNDVTARDLQKIDGQWTRAKGFDTFCPFGPWIRPVTSFSGLVVHTYLNGKKVQEGCSDDMAFPIADLVRYVSRVMTLLPGDLIATGTPHGVGKLVAGDTVSVELQGVLLENPVGA